MRPDPSPSKVSVVRASGRFLVMAQADIEPNEVLLQVHGRVVDRPSRYSIQIGMHEHIDPPLPDRLEDDMDRHPWRFLNHSCEPNAELHGRLLVAIRPILRFEEITFDYKRSEYDMASPFPCECGSATCLGIIRGYKHLTREQRARIAGSIADYLRTLAAAECT